ncbi:biotin--[acetyl-CoA-carboxylase] ligase [Candidatus Aerophobetes bacterium]|uniref:Biotin--[acetyl-CoA-carboxylase] ligase n=1 Tax=Aerophobetes bacterium TaxID=2030807 RepID=A0A2A4X132_UNCAE|nr:MAG: biotin--[acetyl-CoA-carboxylase] ligase [Candidatus Aerophobetes bacterium]
MFEKIEKIHYTSTSSTMDFVDNSKKALDPGTVYRVSADYQSAGRGQFKRSFVAVEKKSLLTSYIFSLQLFKSAPTALFIEIAALTLTTLLKNLKINARIKWPNDILIHHSKIGGLLGKITEKDQISWFNLGIGLNVNLNHEELKTIPTQATSILLETGTSHPIDLLQTQLDNAILKALNTFLLEGFAPFFTSFNFAFILTNKEVQGTYQNKSFSGLCLGLSSLGLVLIQDKKNGKISELNPGQVQDLTAID